MPSRRGDPAQRQVLVTQGEPCRLRCGLYRVAGGRPLRHGLVGAGEDLVLLVELLAATGAGSGPRSLTVELWRGDRLRDRQEHSLSAQGGGRWSGAFRLRWGDRPGASSRLTCRVRLDGEEGACLRALLGPPGVDAQGRLAGNLPPASPATLLAFSEEALRLLRPGP